MSPQNPGRARRATAAAKYQPKRMRLLIAAESPPENEATYFYFEDPAARDELFSEITEVLFEASSGTEKVSYLKELRRRGVFVVELKPDAPRHDEPLGPYVPPFLINAGTLAPEHIILVGPAVYDAAYGAMEKAGLPVVDVRVPTPSSGREVTFRQSFRQALVRADLEKMIRPLGPKPKKPKREKTDAPKPSA
jgi:hypothetical protein